MRPILTVLVVMLLAALCACAPYRPVPGDVCSDPTQTYTPDFAYECNYS